MSYLNDWDKKISNLDVVDDYKSEKQQILEYQGQSFPFSFGDVNDFIHRISVKFVSFLLCLVCC